MSARSPRSQRAKRGLAGLGAVALVAGLTTMVSSPASAAPPTTGRSIIPGSSPSWTSRAQDVGAPAADQPITFRVVLQLRDQAEVERAAARVSDPASSRYGKYLTASQFNARYAPTAAQVASVQAFLTGQGMSVSRVAQGNRWVDATGTVSQVEKAFAASVKTYRFQGRTLRGTPAALSAPAKVAGLIAGVVGVSQASSVATPDHVLPPADTTPRPAARSSASPHDALPAPSVCSTFYGQHEQVGPLAYGRTSFPTVGCGYTPAQLREAYGITSGSRGRRSGKGVTVAIIDAYASPTSVADSNQLSAMNGEPQLEPGQYTETTFAPFDLQDECGGEEGWNEEEALDVEAVHAMAPGANIHYVGAQNCDAGIDEALNYVVQNHVADIVSNSYGDAGEDGLGSEVQIEHSIFLQAALEGIGMYFSSGDDGDNTTTGAPHPEPDYPASDPLVTGVGGTTLGIDSHDRYLFETPWGDGLSSVDTTTSPSTWTQTPPGDFLFGAGGGVSALFSQPFYQRLAVPSSLARSNGSGPMRVVPDVAADADPETGFLIIHAGSPLQIGGTSLAAPVFAAFQAVASQHRRTAIGFANPLLYVLGLARFPFHDVTASVPTPALITPSGRSLLSIGRDTSLTATRGYDDTTGLGTPNGRLLLAAEGLG